MSSTIIVDIALGGEISAEVQGVSGPSCVEQLDWMETIGNVIAQEPTEEYEREPELLREENQSQDQ